MYVSLGITQKALGLRYTYLLCLRSRCQTLQCLLQIIHLTYMLAMKLIKNFTDLHFKIILFSEMISQMKFEAVKQALKLEPLEHEGGWFRRIYGCEMKAASIDRPCGSSIYFALNSKQISRFHMLDSDEIWYYHAGTPGRQILLFKDGHWEERIIGPDLEAGQVIQSVIPHGTWEATSLIDQSAESWGLFGCAVFPGFTFEEFHLSPIEDLFKKYPKARKAIIEAHLDV